MARVSTYLLVFFLALNLWAGVLQASGVDDLLGIAAETGDPNEFDRFEDQQTNVPTGSGTGDDLFSMYNVVGGFFADLYGAIFPGLDMLHRLGLPSYIAFDFLGNLFSAIILVNVGSFFVR